MRNVIALAFGCSSLSILALELGSPFNHDMVLQQGKPVAVWGWASPGETVTVSFAGKAVNAVTDQTGAWKLHLPALTVSAQGRVLKATAPSGEICCTNVLVGEVWFASGQSNMACPLWGSSPRFRDRNGGAYTQITHLPQIRFMSSDTGYGPKPLARTKVRPVWHPFEPKWIGGRKGQGSVSAVAFYFARELHLVTGVPIGLLCAYVGGTGIDTWTPRTGYRVSPNLKDMAEWKWVDAANWPTNWNTYPMKSPVQQPSALWNERVAPLAPFTMKGLIWYQGCHNFPNGEWQRYTDKMRALYTGWQEAFENSDLKFYYAQLACSFSSVSLSQAAYEKTNSNAAMAVIADVGNPDDIHPNEKQTVGLRLAMKALKRDYGFKDIEDASPVPTVCESQGDTLTLYFAHAKSLYLYNADRSLLTNFEIAGSDGRWVRAEIVNLKETKQKNPRLRKEGLLTGRAVVVLRAKGVSAPVKVRYLQAAPYYGGLYNEASLPLGPFAAITAANPSPRHIDKLFLSHVHRGGGAKERPDNTLETFKWCWENGCAVECDCRRTKDGVGIMLHDETLNRTGRGIDHGLATNKVSQNLTWAEIKDVDVGSYQGAQFKGEHIPTIEAVFGAMKGHPTYLAMVDEKGATPKYIAQKAIAAGVQNQVYYTGPSHEQIFRWNEILPGGKSLLWLGAWPRNHSIEERDRVDAWFRAKMAEFRAKDFKFISCVSIHTYYDPKDTLDPFVPSTGILKEMIQEFHAHGIPVVSIPFQGGQLEETYHKLYEMGMDGFSTDYPSVVFKVIADLSK